MQQVMVEKEGDVDVGPKQQKSTKKRIFLLLPSFHLTSENEGLNSGRLLCLNDSMRVCLGFLFLFSVVFFFKQNRHVCQSRCARKWANVGVIQKTNQGIKGGIKKIKEGTVKIEWPSLPFLLGMGKTNSRDSIFCFSPPAVRTARLPVNTTACPLYMSCLPVQPV